MRMTWPGRRELWPRGDEQQHRKALYLFQGTREQLQRGRVRRMDILKDDEHWRSRRQAIELSRKRRQCHLLKLLRAQLWQAAAVIGWQRQKVGQRCHYTVRVSAGPHEQSLKLGELLRRRVASLEPRSPFELAGEWIQRTVSVVCRAELAQRDVWFGLDPLFKRQSNVRLTDTRLSSQQHNAAFAPRRILPATQQQLDLLVTPHYRFQSALVLRLQPSFPPAF